MKKILFIESDKGEHTKEALDSALVRIEAYSQVNMDNAQLEIMDGIYWMEEKDVKDKIWNAIEEGIVIMSYSMYTTTHLGSFYTLVKLLSFVGRNHVKNATYISTSSNLKKALEQFMRQADNYKTDMVLSLMAAVNDNNIISFDSDKGDFCKLTIVPSNDESVLSEPINIASYLR